MRDCVCVCGERESGKESARERVSKSKSIFRTLSCLFGSLEYLLVVGGSVKFPARFINKPKTKGERNQKRERERWSLCLPLTFNDLPMSTVPLFYTHFFYTLTPALIEWRVAGQSNLSNAHNARRDNANLVKC